MRLLYVANARIPTEKAHGLQIMQNCEALAEAGAGVTLWAARRVNTRAMRAVGDPWQFYGVRRNFGLRRLACLDLHWLVGERFALLRRVAFLLQGSSWLLSLTLALLTGGRAEVYYTRDLAVAALLILLRGGGRLAYEPHRLSASATGRRLQARVMRRAGSIFPLTSAMAREAESMGASPETICVLHDGIRAERFRNLPSRAEARRQLGWREDRFVVGYVGQLQTMGLDKGAGGLIDAVAQLEGAAVALVGGPADSVAELHDRWRAAGRRDDDFLAPGQVKPDAVPLYLAAFDACAMPFPWTEHFAWYASPVQTLRVHGRRAPAGGHGFAGRGRSRARRRSRAARAARRRSGVDGGFETIAG